MAFLALMKSGVSVARANIPLPFISCSMDFLYSLCKQQHGVRYQRRLCAARFGVSEEDHACLLSGAAKPKPGRS